MKHLSSLFDKLCTPEYHVVANLDKTSKVGDRTTNDNIRALLPAHTNSFSLRLSVTVSPPLSATGSSAPENATQAVSHHFFVKGYK